MSRFIDDNRKTNIILVDDEHTFTRDHVFAIEPVGKAGYVTEDQTYSEILYIKQGHAIDPISPLATLISDGVIVKHPTPVSLITVHAKKKTSGKPKVKQEHQMYDVYQFYRDLRDNRAYDADDNPDYDDDASINENDCLKTAECLTIASQTRDKRLFETLLEASKSPPILRTSITNRIFAETESDKDNIKIIKDIGLSKKNNYAIPVMGESYAIVRKKIDQNSAYHAAFVVYTHDGVNITIEAEADAGPTYRPRFAFYDTNPEGNTFHRRWSAELYKKSTDSDHQIRYQALYHNGETIVLKSRELSDILRELEAERLHLVSRRRKGPSKKRKTSIKHAGSKNKTKKTTER
jgi:hypothetical protein